MKKRKNFRGLTIFTVVMIAICFAISFAITLYDKDIKVFGKGIAATETNNNIDYLVLVNKQNKLPDDWEEKVQLETVTDIDGDECQVEKEALLKYYELREDLAKNDGVYIELDSCYRSVAAQEDLWARFKEEYGEDYVKKYVAVPGFSEHHTGLAIDICIIKNGEVIDDNDMMIAEREIFSKIHAKLADYGFILRYLEGKDDITGYAYEPWHLRYVGSPEVAKEITEKGLTFEEYLGK